MKYDSCLFLSYEDKLKYEGYLRNIENGYQDDFI